MDVTTDPGLRSFVEIPADSSFPIQNLPYGIFRPKGETEPRAGVAIGDRVLDLGRLETRGFFDEIAGFSDRPMFRRASLNVFLELGRPTWLESRRTISKLLRVESNLRGDSELERGLLHPMEQVELSLPVEIGDYTDFYSSREHATNVGTMFRGKENALMPNWLHLPVAYHGRASSVVLSGTPVRRPCGQTRPDDAKPPQFGPSRLLDIELEMGFFVGTGSELGQPIRVENAKEHIFGMVLVNDWSARDIQKWEYQPLGPFLAKNFATTISPWIVPLEALEPFRCSGPSQDPEPLPYLRGPRDLAYDIELDVLLQTETMSEPFRIARSNFKHMYWNIAQQLAHHTVTGCNVRPGDLMASGTISGPTRESWGSLLELTWRGTEPIELPGGEERRFLQDGDTVVLRGHCQGEGYRIGFGDCAAQILPALPVSEALSWFWVTAIGRDRPGIVVELATALAEQGGNIEDASMSRFKNWFAVMVLVAFDGDPDLQGSLGGVARRMDLTLDVRPVPAEDRMDAGSGTPTHRVSVYGADAPGIVATVARRLRDRGANVVDLSTDVARPAETAGAASKPEDGALDDVPGEESGGAAAGTSATPPGALFVMVMDVETDPLLGKDDPLAGLAGELAEELSMEVRIVPLEGVIL